MAAMQVNSDSSTIAPDRSEAVDRSRIWRVAALAAGIAVAVNLVLWAIARGLLDVSGDFMPLGTPIPTIVVTVLATFAAAAVLFLLDRFVRRPISVFLGIGVAFALLSLLGPLPQDSEPGGSTEAVIILMLMHLATAAIVLGLLTTRARAR